MSVTHDDRIYYQDQTAWEPVDFYALWRYLNKLFLNQRGRKTAEIAALDLSHMSEDTCYLMKHLLILQGRYDQMLHDFENLRALRGVPDTGRKLILAERPTFAHPYFTEKGIYL